jgi:dihydroorotate dehydrogenase
LRGLGQLGFGHVEVGTSPAVAQPGNERPACSGSVDDRAL